MQENFLTALYLMIIGMATVFVVLALIVWSGRFLIMVVNRFAPPDTSALRRPDRHRKTTGAGPSPAQLAAIVAAVSIATEGKGRIVRIEQQKTPSTE